MKQKSIAILGALSLWVCASSVATEVVQRVPHDEGHGRTTQDTRPVRAAAVGLPTYLSSVDGDQIRRFDQLIKLSDLSLIESLSLDPEGLLGTDMERGPWYVDQKTCQPINLREKLMDEVLKSDNRKRLFDSRFGAEAKRELDAARIGPAPVWSEGSDQRSKAGFVSDKQIYG